LECYEKLSPAQKKKKSGPELECYERIERLEIWIDVRKGKSDVASLGEDKKKSLSFTY
jgi:hypothetical protein